MRLRKIGSRGMTAKDLELKVARYFGYTRNVIVPNISWGIGLNYEADIVVLRKSDYAVEVEIKVTKQDIKKDLEKKHNHDSNLFRELWFAVPEKLAEDSFIPLRAGILSITPTKAVVYRRPVINKNAVKWTMKQRLKLYELASIRTWKLKNDLLKEKRRRT